MSRERACTLAGALLIVAAFALAIWSGSDGPAVDGRLLVAFVLVGLGAGLAGNATIGGRR